MMYVRQLLTAVVAVSCAFAQDPRGTILGRVTDSTEAVIPNVEVRATNVATGVSVAARTNAAGNYVMPFLLPGTYTVVAELTGFNKVQRENIQVRVAESIEVNLLMQPGELSQTIEIKDEAPLLNTTSASLGQVVDQRRILDLPLMAGNPLELINLTTGVVEPSRFMWKAAWNFRQLPTDGNGAYGNDFQIDGVSNTAAEGNAGRSRYAFAPPAEAQGEFQMQTAPYDASVGHTIGALVNVSTRGGTNDFHGESHWFVRNRAFDARSFFNNKFNTNPPVYQDNRWGASLGGPVSLPKLYQGKNKTFFFYTYEGNRWTVPTPSTYTVPSKAQRDGDFSALPAPITIYDPLTTRPAADGRFARTAFPGNVIPKSRLNPVGMALANLYPLPNQAGNAEGRNNFFNGTAKAPQDYYVHFARVDHAFNEAHRAFVRVQYDKWTEDKDDHFNNGINGIILNRVNRGIALDDVVVLSPTLVLNVRYGITQQDFLERRRTQGYDLASLGFSKNLLSLIDASQATVPRVRNGYAMLSSWESGDGATNSLTHSFATALTKLHKDHNLKFGADFRVYRAFGDRHPAAVAPDFRFENTYTRGPFDNSPGATIGQELAAMLLGIPGGSMERTASFAMQDTYLGLYLHDEWKMNRKLTLSLGLRYELETPLTERFNRLVGGFDFAATNPIQAAVQANYAKNPIPGLSTVPVRGGLTWVSDGQRSPFSGEKNNFLPRIGIAYQLTPKTTVRTGFGIYYDTLGVNMTRAVQTGFSQTTQIVASRDSGQTYVANVADPFPNGLLDPLGPKGGLTTNLGQAVEFYNAGLKHPYAQRWSLGIQRILPAQFLIDSSYVANRGTRVRVVRQYNALPLQYLSTKPYRDAATISYLTENSPNPFLGQPGPYNASTSRSELFRPFPAFGAISAEDSIGYSWYHSLQTKLERRFSRGFTFQLGYTWSKAMEATEFLNAADPMPYEQIANFDRTHRLTMSGIWELPFGNGRAIGSGMPAPLNVIAGGWQLGMTVIRQGGGPINWWDNVFFNGDPDNIALPKSQRSVDRWFNADAGFNRKSGEQPSFAVRTWPLRFSGLRGDGRATWDFSAIKNFMITEQLKLQFRAECYNAWNHANFRDPVTNPLDSSMGAIWNTTTDPRMFQLSLRLRF